MRIVRWGAVLSVLLLCGRLAMSQGLPPVPSKVLPTAGAAPEAPGQVKTFESAKQRSYTIRTVPDDREREEPPEPQEELAEEDVALRTDPDGFRGTARRASKLSLADAPMEPFADLPDLLATLPDHDSMKDHQPPIGTGSGSNRVAEEKRNVRLQGFLYAASRERDNDYHLILGRDPSASPERYMTAELSGLPRSDATAFPALKGARDSFKTFFGSDMPGMDYDFYDPPIPVIVEGSLFWDASHATGSRPGPSSLRPNMPVIWEIHPISRIEFEP